MRNVLTIAIAVIWLVFPAKSQEVQENLIYPSLDKAIISMRAATLDGDFEETHQVFRQLESVWEEVSRDIVEYQMPHFRFPEFVEVQDIRLSQMSDDLYAKDYQNLMSNLDLFRRELMDIRECIGMEYPLDVLWRFSDLYEEVQHAIYDQMMDLREWFDFEDDVTELFSLWNQYELLSHNLNTGYFPGFDLVAQKLINDQMEICRTEFLSSLETGYRTHFAIPCDKIGDTLEEAFNLYIDKTIVGS